MNAGDRRMIASTLSAVVLAEQQSQTARQKSALQKMPSTSACHQP
jgi:hypothetical protein